MVHDMMTGFISLSAKPGHQMKFLIYKSAQAQQDGSQSCWEHEYLVAQGCRRQ